MQTKAKQRNGFRPVQVKLNFDNALEYHIFTRIVSMDYTIPKAIVQQRKFIVRDSGVVVSDHDVEACATGMLHNIYKHLPKGGK